MPALNTQSVLNVVEIETERLKLRVAQSLANLQDEAYRKLKQQLLDDRKDYRQMAVSKDERIRVLELQLTGQSNKLETAVLQLLKLAGKSGERYKKLDGIRLCRSVWRQWMRYLILARRERRHERLPEVHFGKVFGRKVLGAWRTAARAERISRVDSYWRSQVEEARTRAASEQQERTESLEAQLAQANEAMRIGVEQRDALEAELKRAFMRGVCALNMEAVSILRHGTAGPRFCSRAIDQRAWMQRMGAHACAVNEVCIVASSLPCARGFCQVLMRAARWPPLLIVQHPPPSIPPRASAQRLAARNCDHCRC